MLFILADYCNCNLQSREKTFGMYYLKWANYTIFLANRKAVFLLFAAHALIYEYNDFTQAV
jgi:hypothetical protein